MRSSPAAKHLNSLSFFPPRSFWLHLYIQFCTTILPSVIGWFIPPFQRLLCLSAILHQSLHLVNTFRFGIPFFCLVGARAFPMNGDVCLYMAWICHFIMTAILVYTLASPAMLAFDVGVPTFRGCLGATTIPNPGALHGSLSTQHRDCLFFLSAYNDSNIMHIWVVPNSSESLTQFVVCSLASLSFPFTSILLFSLVSGSQAYTSWGFEHHMPPLWIAIYLEHLQMNLIFIFCYQPFESCTFFSYYATCIYFYLHLPSPPDSSTFDLPLPLSNAIDYDITSATNSKGDIFAGEYGFALLTYDKNSKPLMRPCDILVVVFIDVF